MHRLADVVEDDVDAACRRSRSMHDRGEVLGRVVDDRRRRRGRGRAAPSRRTRRWRTRVAPACDRQLDRRRARAARPRRGSARVSPACSSARSNSPSHARWNGKKSAAASGQRDVVGHLERRDGRADRRTRRSRRGRPSGDRRRPAGRASASVPGPQASTMPMTSMPGAVRQLGPHHHVAAGDALEVVEVERDRRARGPVPRPARARGRRTSSSWSTSPGSPYSWVRQARIVVGVMARPRVQGPRARGRSVRCTGRSSRRTDGGSTPYSSGSVAVDAVHALRVIGDVGPHGASAPSSDIGRSSAS